MKEKTCCFNLFSACLISLLFLELFVPGDCAAMDGSIHATPPEATGKNEDDMPFLDEKQEVQLDTYQQDATTLLLSAADWFDNFFDDDNYSAESNRTRIKVSLDAGYTERDDVEFKPRASLRLNVPHLTSKVNLLLFASDSSEIEAEENPISAIPRHTDSERSELTTALQYFLREGRRKNISFLTGLSFNYLYGGLRYRYFHDLGSWQFRCTDSVLYYTDDGWENRASIQFERHISERLLFRTLCSLDWLEKRESFPHSLTLRLFHVLNQKQAIQYDAATYFDTEPDYTFTELQLRLRYRQRFYRDWLVLEIAPVVSFPEKKDYDFSPGIIFRLEAVFGYKSDSRLYNAVFNF